MIANLLLLNTIHIILGLSDFFQQELKVSGSNKGRQKVKYRKISKMSKRCVKIYF